MISMALQILSKLNYIIISILSWDPNMASPICALLLPSVPIRRCHSFHCKGPFPRTIPRLGCGLECRVFFGSIPLSHVRRRDRHSRSRLALHARRREQNDHDTSTDGNAATGRRDGGAKGARGSTKVPSSKGMKEAKEAIETGLEEFEAKRYAEALALFETAMDLSPNEDEARAALYNAACAHAKLQQWQQSAESVVRAVNEYNLKLVVALRDPDLAELRERREWTSALEQATGGLTSEAYVKLRAEARNPFRPARILIFGALSAGAALGLIIISSRLVSALKGGEGAPDLQESIQNFAINASSLAILSFFLIRDIREDQKTRQTIIREEQLSDLQIKVGNEKVLPLAALRGTVRPVILTGNKGQVSKAIREAELYKSELRARGVSLIPVVLSDDDPGERLRRLKLELAAEGSEGSDQVPVPSAASKDSKNASQGFGSNKSRRSSALESDATATSVERDRRWQVEAFDLPAWESWLREQVKGANNAQLNYYVQVQLDGTVRASGVGNPPWEKFIVDLPPLDDVRTKLTDGRGIA